MWAFPHRGTVFFWMIFATSLVESQQCPEGLFWCQDRCGTDADTCCQTPDGQHNLCGPGTICCGFGCCPDSSFTCNPDFSCTGPDGEVIPPAPNPTPSGEPGLTTGGGKPSSMTEVESQTLSQPNPTDGDLVGPGIGTVGIPVVTSPTTHITSDQTLTLELPSNTFSSGLPSTWDGLGTGTTTTQDPETTTLGDLESTSTLSPSVPPNPSPEPDSGTSTLVNDETQTSAFPSVTEETTTKTEGQITTSILSEDSTTIIPNDGEPQLSGTTEQDTTATVPIATSDGTQASVSPPVTKETSNPIPGGASTTMVSGDEGEPQPPETTKQEETVTSPSVIVDEPETSTIPAVDEGTTETTDGHTATHTPDGSPTVTIPDDDEQPQRPTSTDQELPQTTEGETATLVPGAEPTSTGESLPTQEPAPTEEPDSASNPLPTHTKWPSEGVLKPVEIEVEKPQPSNQEEDDDNGDDNDDDDSAIIPCKMWFFSICIKFDNINILGWELNLPPVGLLHLKNIKFPPSIEVQGDLPPWPEFTVGPDHVPTFPSEPESTQCETKTASLCFASTSYVVSTVDGAEETVSSQVLPPTCGEVRGCLVTDSTQTQEATSTKTGECSAATVTDVAVTCSRSGTTACSTTTENPRTGCSVTATTTTATCTPIQTGDGNARRETVDNACPLVETYIVWPRDGTKTDETNAIQTAMENLLQDESKIRISDTQTLGVDFWRASIDAEQAQKIREIPNVATVYRECTDCPDLLTTATNWRYQSDYAERHPDNFIHSGRPQMSFLSHKEHSMTDFFTNHPKYDPDQFNNHYTFDVSSGEDVEVYILDTGANLHHAVSLEVLVLKLSLMTYRNLPKATTWPAKPGSYLLVKIMTGRIMKMNPGSLSAVAASPVIKIHCKPHGTSMLDTVAGAKLGIAKKVKPVLVRLPRRHKLGRGYKPEDIITGLSKINDDIKGKSKETRAILSVSLYVDFRKFTSGTEDPGFVVGFDTFKRRLYQEITSLIEKGVFVVTGSGNSAVCEGWPALFGAQTSRVKPDKQKDWLYIPEFPELDLPHIYAPASNVLVADADRGNWVDGNPETFREGSGTSIATAYTAGLAAYFLRLHQIGRLGRDAQDNEPDMSPAGLKRYILNNGWSRVKSDFEYAVGIWNGADPGLLQLQGVCPYEPDNPALHLRSPQQENADPLTGQCIPGMSPTTSPTGEPTPFPSEITTDRTTFQISTKGSQPSGIPCTKEEAHLCAPALICSAPRRNGCIDGLCACILPEPPPPETTTRNLEQTTEPDPKPTSEPEPEPTSEPEPEPEPTKTPLEVGSRHCNDEDDFTGHGDVSGTDVFQLTVDICRESNMIGPGDRWEQNFDGPIKQSEVNFQVKWVQGCVTDVDKQDIADPLGDNGLVGKNRCFTQLYGNWKQCINGGVGGWIDAGCLRYYMGPGHILK